MHLSNSIFRATICCSALLWLPSAISAESTAPSKPKAQPTERASCVVSELKIIALGTHDVAERKASVHAWFKKNGRACTTDQLFVIRNNRPLWMGTADNLDLALAIDSMLEQYNKNPGESSKVAQELYGTKAGLIDGDVLLPKIAGAKVLEAAAAGSKLVFALKKDDQLIYLGEEKNGFLKVLGAEGEGWVDKLLLKK